MKKALAIVLCLIMVAAVAVSTISADETKRIDGRELQEYGQLHYYLGDPVGVTNTPNVTDGKVGEGEYVLSHWFGVDSPNTEVTLTDSETGGFIQTEGATIYMAYDNEKLYLAAEVLDHAYYPDKDYVMFQIGGRNGGKTVDGVSRLTFTIRGDASNGTVSGDDVKTSFGEADKNDDGSWKAKTGVVFDDFVAAEDKSISYNAQTEILTCEVAINLEDFLNYWGNDQELEDVRLYFFVVLKCRGDSAEGADDGPLEQGYIWHYMNSQLDTNLKLNFVLDYPETSYFMEFFPHILHFCDEPEPTTPAPTTTPEPTTTPTPTTVPPAAVKTTTAASTTETPAVSTTVAEEKGCGGTVALAALAIVPMIGTAVVIGKRKES